MKNWGPKNITSYHQVARRKIQKQSCNQWESNTEALNGLSSQPL